MFGPLRQRGLKPTGQCGELQAVFAAVGLVVCGQPYERQRDVGGVVRLIQILQAWVQRCSASRWTACS
ncbi:hypothetical protein PI87_20925 [Ralstonia sp. A12]|nr:hypothetical protein PI87_20925 [Ralstonia sp. A12]